VRQQWGDWLATMEWTWFLTITFREAVAGYRQETAVHAAGNMLSRSHAVDRLFICAEPHMSKATHLHGLYKSASDRPDVLKFQKLDVWRLLFKTFGRSSVEPPRGKDAVSRYVAKYCVKGTGYYEMWGPSEGRGAPHQTYPGGYVEVGT